MTYIYIYYFFFFSIKAQTAKPDGAESIFKTAAELRELQTKMERSFSGRMHHVAKILDLLQEPGQNRKNIYIYIHHVRGFTHWKRKTKINKARKSVDNDGQGVILERKVYLGLFSPHLCVGF